MSDGGAPNAPARPLSTAVTAGVGGRCPRCGEGPLFRGFLEPARACTACGLDYAFIDSGDGPAVFVMLPVGFLIVGAALVVEVKWHPPVWVHMVLWLPLVLALGIGLLRPLKGLMIALQYHYRAREGRVEAP